MDAIITILQQIASALFAPVTEAGTGGAVPIFWAWITSETVLPFFLIGVGVSLLLLAIRVVKSVFWGV